MNLNDLLDVTLTAPLTAGTALVYDGAGQWRNRRLIMDDLGDADTTTTPPTDGQVLTWDAGTGQWRPETATAGGCQLLELGGASGVLVVGDGIGVPNPVATGWTLQADSLHGVLTTPPAGGATTVEVRLFPANTLISTGTFAAASTTATWTAFAALALADGQWIETRVTAIAPTPGSELTVSGELCGPGGTSATPTTVVQSFTHTQAAAATTWVINHNLGFNPAGIQVEDGAGVEVTPNSITYNSVNQLTLTFVVAQAGTARLS